MLKTTLYLQQSSRATANRIKVHWCKLTINSDIVSEVSTIIQSAEETTSNNANVNRAVSDINDHLKKQISITHSDITKTIFSIEVLACARTHLFDTMPAQLRLEIEENIKALTTMQYSHLSP
jgi:hypothetical protein